jgi:hypothetical protein
MRKAIFLLLPAALGLAAAIPPAAAEASQRAPAASAPARQTVAVPFEPPLGRPIRYRRTKEVVQSSGTRTVWNTTQYVFTRGAHGGYRMQVTAIDSGVNGGNPAAAALSRRLSTMFSEPYVILVDARGEILGVEDEDGYWNRMIAAVERVIRTMEGVDSAGERAALSQAMAMFHDMPRQSRLALMVEDETPILELSGNEFVLGEARESEQPVTNALGTPMVRHVTVRPERVADGYLFLTARMTVPREAMIAATEAMSARIPVTGSGQNTEAERARVLEQIRNADFIDSTEATYEVSLTTGLVRRSRSVERIELGVGAERTSKTTTILIERID